MYPKKKRFINVKVWGVWIKLVGSDFINTKKKKTLNYIIKDITLTTQTILGRTLTIILGRTLSILMKIFSG